MTRIYSNLFKVIFAVSFLLLAMPASGFAQNQQEIDPAKMMESLGSQEELLKKLSSGDLNNPDLKKAMEMLDTPEARAILGGDMMDKAKSAMAGVNAYNGCLEKKLGAGSSKRITEAMMANLNEFQAINTKATELCRAGKRDEAKAFSKEESKKVVKSKLPGDFAAIETCSEIPEVKKHEIHPCDSL